MAIGRRVATGFNRRLLGGLALFATVTVAVPVLTVAAASGSFSTTPQNISPNVGQDNGHALAPGDIVSVGFALSDHNHSNPASTIYLEDAKAVLGITCSQHGAQVGDLVVALPPGPYSYPAAYNSNGGWWPTNRWQDPSTYRVSVSLGNWCNGGDIFVVNNGESYTGELASPDNTTDQFHVQLHTAIPAANNNGGNIDCASPTANPPPGTRACQFNQNGDADNLLPSTFSAPTPTPTPTPRPTPTPSPAGSGGHGTGGTGSGNVPGQSTGAALSRLPVVGGASGAAATGGRPVSSTNASTPATGSQTSTAPAGSAPSSGGSPSIAPGGPGRLPVITAPVPRLSPIGALGSSGAFSDLPIGWFIALAALDGFFVVVIVGRRRRDREHERRSSV